VFRHEIPSVRAVFRHEINLSPTTISAAPFYGEKEDAPTTRREQRRCDPVSSGFVRQRKFVVKLSPMTTRNTDLSTPTKSRRLRRHVRADRGPSALQSGSGKAGRRAPGAAATRSANAAAYHGGTPGGRFIAGNPGRPSGARDRRQRAPRGSGQILTKACARLLRVDQRTGRAFLIDPGTQKPLLDVNRRAIYEPTVADLVLVALQYRLLGPHSSQIERLFLS
jgi:hypothetical protein